MNINDFAKEIHENAVAHGWWNKPREFPEVAALIHSEISEALEEWRDGKPLYYCGSESASCERAPITGKIEIDGEAFLSPCPECESGSYKPEGLAVELADAIIRILDYTASAGIDIDAVIMAKHRYNKGRPYRHGGKRA